MRIWKIPAPAAPGRYEWNRGEMLALASANCVVCLGTGQRGSSHNSGGASPCGCALRAVFRICHRQWRDIQAKDASRWEVHFGTAKAPHRRSCCGRKDQEYTADFELTARRVLTELEHGLFRLHYIQGCGFRLCCRRLGLDRGAFFHAIYRVEEKLGRALREMRPYALYPVDEYFGGRRERVEPVKAADGFQMPAFRRAA